MEPKRCKHNKGMFTMGEWVRCMFCGAGLYLIGNKHYPDARAIIKAREAESHA